MLTNKQYYEYIYQDPNGKLINYGRGIENRTKVIKQARDKGGKAYCRRITIENYQLDIEEERK